MPPPPPPAARPQSLRSIGPFVAERFCEIVKARNALARLSGYEDFYDMKARAGGAGACREACTSVGALPRPVFSSEQSAVPKRPKPESANTRHAPARAPQVTAAEGFGKARLFEIMDDLESKTRGINEAARAALAKDKGAAALEPHNIGHALAGGCCVLRALSSPPASPGAAPHLAAQAGLQLTSLLAYQLTLLPPAPHVKLGRAPPGCPAIVPSRPPPHPQATPPS
jgi:hypothetical protein